MSSNYPRGIDVSNRNGIFDWPSWRGYIDFAAAKATEGLDFLDDQFPRNWEYMRKLGVYRFAYHYGHPNLDPTQQAAYFTNYVKAQGLLPHDNFYLDLEESDGLSPIDVSFWAWTFCHEINRLNPGHRVLVYCDPSFAEDGNCAKLGGWGLWIANYDVPTPAVPAPWKYWRFWQNTGSSLDQDVWNGSLETLQEYCERMPTPEIEATVPNVKGLFVNDAESKIKAANLVPDVTSGGPRNPLHRYIIISQTPGGGTVLPQGSKISLAIARS